MTELTWFILVIWALLLILWFKSKSVLFGGGSGIIGLFLGLTLISDMGWLGFAVIFINIGLLYLALISGTERKKKRR